MAGITCSASVQYERLDQLVVVTFTVESGACKAAETVSYHFCLMELREEEGTPVFGDGYIDILHSKTATYCGLDLSLCLSEDSDSAIPAAHSLGIFSFLNQLIP